MKMLIILLFSVISGPIYASQCDGVQVAKTLDSMLDVGRFHHCAFEVVKIESSEIQDNGSTSSLVSYLVYGKDLFRCKTTNKCPTASFEITLDKACLNGSIEFSDLEKNSNGYNLDGRMMRNHMQIKFNAHKDPTQISFGQTDLSDAKRINYVNCQLNPLSEN